VPTTKYAAYLQRYQKSFLAQVDKVSESIRRAAAQGRTRVINKTIVKMIRAGGPELRDSWGNNLHIEPVPWDAQKKYYLVHSAGPDKQFDTGDDLGIYLQVYRRKVVGHKSTGPSAIEANIEHGRGSLNGLVEMNGTVVDQVGGAIEGAAVKIREVSTGRVRTVIVNADGKFHWDRCRRESTKLRFPMELIRSRKLQA